MKNLIICLLFLCSININAQDIPKDTLPPKPSVPNSKKDTTGVPGKSDVASKAKPPAKKDEIKPYNEVITKEAVTQKGLFWTHKVDKNWFFEVNDSLFNRDILVVTRYISVPGGANVYGGEQINQQMVRFEKGPDDNVFLRLIATIAVADSTELIYKAVELSNSNPIIAAFPIKAIGKNSTVIDVSSYLSGDNAAISLKQNIKKSLNLGGLLADRSFIEKISSYPINVEVRTTKTFTVTPSQPSAQQRAPSRGGSFNVADDAGVVTLEINNSFLLLPKSPASRRLFDPRVGFFADRYTKFSDDQQRSDKQTFIVRWKLEPKPQDYNKWKNGQLVEPQNPIVFYIDPATPKQWVKYLMLGVNDWQKAFEKAGFKNAIYAKEWPKNDTTMSLEDARYSVIRYFASDIENAYGPNVHDPRSGEIIESHIGWYHNVMKLLQNWYMIQSGPNDKRAQQMKFPDELMGQLIRFVSSHEVGHTLGLRHNFGSSSTVPVEKLRNKKWVEANGHTPSIMDYARFNYVAQPEDNISEKGLFPRIGDYDEWAIQWGYSYSGAKNTEEDKKITNKWIVENLKKNPRLWFGTETNPWDPRSQSECIGDNNMLASEYGLKNLQRVVQNLPKWTKEEADRYENLSEVMQQVLVQYNRYMNHVLKNVGGVEETFKSVEEKGAVYAPTNRNTQREAVAFLHKYLFVKPDWIAKADIMDITNNPASSDYFTRVQQSILGNLLSGTRLNMLGICEERFPEANPYKMDEMLTDVESGIWKELQSGAAIPQYRRDLQKHYVTALAKLVANQKEASSESSTNPFTSGNDFSNTDVASVARAFLVKLKDSINSKLPSVSDSRTKYHLMDVEQRIKETLDVKK
ncbi:MAG: zinc-dependent metalloprotease [Niabella sp.]